MYFTASTPKQKKRSVNMPRDKHAGTDTHTHNGTRTSISQSKQDQNNTETEKDIQHRIIRWPYSE